MKVHHRLVARVGFDREDIARAVALHVDAGRIERIFNVGEQLFGLLNKFGFGHNSLLNFGPSTKREIPMVRTIAAIVCLTAVAALTACGIKGPLYLPDTTSPAQTAPAK